MWGGGLSSRAYTLPRASDIDMMLQRVYTADPATKVTSLQFITDYTSALILRTMAGVRATLYGIYGELLAKTAEGNKGGGAERGEGVKGVTRTLTALLATVARLEGIYRGFLWAAGLAKEIGDVPDAADPKFEAGVSSLKDSLRQGIGDLQQLSMTVLKASDLASELESHMLGWYTSFYRAALRHSMRGIGAVAHVSNAIRQVLRGVEED